MPTRPDLTSHDALIDDLVDRVNAEAMYKLTDTDIVKLAIERMWVTAHPGEMLPEKLKRKRYIRLQF